MDNMTIWKRLLIETENRYDLKKNKKKRTYSLSIESIYISVLSYLAYEEKPKSTEAEQIHLLKSCVYFYKVRE